MRRFIALAVLFAASMATIPAAMADQVVVVKTHHRRHHRHHHHTVVVVRH